MEKNVTDYVKEVAIKLKSAGVSLYNSIYPTEAQLQEFLNAPYEGKLYLVSLIIFTADPMIAMAESAKDGRSFGERYQTRTQGLGIMGVLSGEILGTLIGEADGIAWDTISIIEIPNKQAFMDYYLGDPELQVRRESFVGKMRTIVVRAPN